MQKSNYHYTLPEISDKMATTCLVICIRLTRMAIDFYQEIHRTQHFSRNYSKQKA